MQGDAGKVEALCREILENVLADVQRRYEELPQSLRTVAEQAQARHEQAASTLRDEYREKNERDRKRRLAQALFNAQRTELVHREQILTNLLEAARTAASKRWEQGPRDEMILGFVLEAHRSLHSFVYEVIVSSHSEPAFSSELPDRVAKVLSQESGTDITVSFNCDPAQAAGVIVASDKGRKHFDNTLVDRFRRSEEFMRTQLVDMLEAKSEEPGTGGTP